MNVLKQAHGFILERALDMRKAGMLIATLPVCVTMAACSVAPGMRMEQPAVLPTNASSASSADSSLQVPIADIDLNLIERMHEEAQKVSPAWIDLTRASQAYTVGPGDVLQITVWDHPELAAALGAQPQSSTRAADAPPGFVVDQDGTLQFPFVGRVHVAGLQPEKIQAIVAKALSKSFQSPQVTVRIASFRAKQVFIEGEVHTPGSQQLNDIPMTLYDAIGRAGGLAATADQSRIALVRDGVQHNINLTDMAERGQSPSRIVLQSGDLLRVPGRDESGVFVMGEVNKPVTAVPMKSGKLTLSDALSQAGSLNSTSADAAQLYVIRGGEGKAPRVFHLDATSPVAMLLANQFDLQAKDVVYVDGNGLVRFSRVLSLLLPAINAGLTTAIVTK
jgi:polysaccharide export outer membrane protein